MMFFFLLLNLATEASIPSLLKPIRLIIPLSFCSLNNLGLGFPACGNGVTVPISINPKPKDDNSLNSFESLSKPAAKPTGLSNFSPNTSRSKLVSLTLNIKRKTHVLPGIMLIIFIILKAI